jgi:hypothetical protein
MSLLYSSRTVQPELSLLFYTTVDGKILVCSTGTTGVLAACLS